jgi:uncharacterized protein
MNPRSIAGRAARVLLLVAIFPATVHADFDAGTVAYGRGDYVTARNEWLPLAHTGDSASQFSLGVLYSEGLGVEADYTEAARWYTLAAKQGVIAAQFTLGVMYAQGLGVETNRVQSARWYDKAARQGDGDAQFALGLIYSQGVGVARDQTIAVKWFKQAAVGGLAVAQASLGIMYQLGEGVPQDDVCAYGWFNLAAANGSERAQQKRDALREQMTLAQVERAQGFGRAFAKTGVCESPKVPIALVDQVREQLKKLGYDPGPNDDGAEARTSSGVMAFQRDLGLTPTGQISEELLMLMRARDK